MPRQQERYCAELVSTALGGIKYIAGKRFPFLRGDPTPNHQDGVTLPVDAYYPDYKLVLEFREGQHYGDRFDFRDGRITATGVTRKEQRLIYDKRREEVLQVNEIKLLIIYDYELLGNAEKDLSLVKQKLTDMNLHKIEEK